MKRTLYTTFALALFFILPTISKAAELPIEAFSEPSDASYVRLAPDGKNIAFVARINTPDMVGRVISVVNVDTKERKNYGFTDNSKFRYYGLDWLNNETLNLRVEHTVLKGKTTSFDTRMYKLDIATGATDDLVPNTLFSKQGNWTPNYYGYVVDNIDADPDHFLFATTTEKSYGTEIYLISLKGDEPVLVQNGVNRYYSWMTDQQSRVRLASANRGRDKVRIVLRDINGSSFKTLWEFDIDSNEEIIPIGFDFDPNILYIKAMLDDRWVIYKVDLADSNLARTLIYDNPDEIPLGTIRYSTSKKKAVGVYKGEGQGFTFWDKEHQKLYETINRALPDLENDFYDLSLDENRLLVYSHSDVESGAYYVWDRTTKTVDLLAFRNEALSPELMTKQVHTKFTTRDGLEHPVMYTFPKGEKEKKPTLIVLIREPGLLFVEGFYTRAQFLANRGYNVVHANLREPDSKDKAYLNSGIVGWGADSINDLDDLAKQLSKNDAVDAENICILGDRYGGTIALATAAQAEYPFKCVISIGGVTNLRDYLKFKRNYNSYGRHSRIIGEKIRYSMKYSPNELVENIKTPVLLVHGEVDKMVEASQSRELYKSLVANAAPVKYVEIEGAANNMDKAGETRQLYESIEGFLDEVTSE